MKSQVRNPELPRSWQSMKILMEAAPAAAKSESGFDQAQIEAALAAARHPSPAARP